MSDLRNDVEKKGKRTMKLRKLFLLWGTVALAGCAHVDPNPAFRELANTVHLRNGKRVQWNRGSAEDAQEQAAVASRLPELPGSEVSTSQLELRAIHQRLDLAAARQQFIAEARARGIARAEAILQGAEIGAHYEHEIEGGVHSIGPSVNVPIPIFNQGQPAAARASAKMRQAGQRYLALAADIRSDVRASRDKMLLSRRQVEYFKSTALPIRTRVTEESQLEYNAMQIGPFQLLQAKQEEVKTGADSVEALRDYWVARTELEKAVGGSLSGKFISLQSESKEGTH